MFQTPKLNIEDDMSIKAIANQMMKGIYEGTYAPNSTEKTRKEFLQKHEALIKEIKEHMPSRMYAALYAVLAKAAIHYGKPKTFEFMNNFSKGKFDGTNDPVRLLWEYLINSRKKEPNKIYRYCVCAIKAFCENRKLTHLRPAESDIIDFVKNN